MRRQGSCAGAPCLVNTSLPCAASIACRLHQCTGTKSVIIHTVIDTAGFGVQRKRNARQHCVRRVLPQQKAARQRLAPYKAYCKGYMLGWCARDVCIPVRGVRCCHSCHGCKSVPAQASISRHAEPAPGQPAHPAAHTAPEPAAASTQPGCRLPLPAALGALEGAQQSEFVPALWCLLH